MKKKILAFAMALIMGLTAAGCGSLGTGGKGGADSADSAGSKTKTSFNYGGKTTLNIISGSENKELSDIIDSFAKKEKINIEMTYKGSLDIMRVLQSDSFKYDAVWPASSMWIQAGDTKHRVKHQESISTTPVVFGIKKSVADSLGFTGKDVKVAEIEQAITDGKLKFCMTSATQSNSGCSAYIGFLYALLGNPDVITSDDLQNEELKTNIKNLLNGVDRSSGSSDWLKDMFLNGNFDAMVNYECLIISANQELEKEGKEPLTVVYPSDGLAIADSPLGYVDQGDSKKEDAFKKFQDYLLSDEVQDEIQKTGRRTGFSGISDENKKNVFKSEWGIQADKTLSTFKMPSSDVLFEALDMYQTEFKKPSLNIYCLDFSGSMYGDGQKQLTNAMDELLDQDKAKENFLQASEDEINIIVPFDSEPRDILEAAGNDKDTLLNLDSEIQAESPEGGTNIYNAIYAGLDYVKDQGIDINNYTPAIILMTDGQSESDDDFESKFNDYNMEIPIFSIMFGDADSTQLDALAKLTNARVFDGTKDLTNAFRTVKGYN